MKVFGGELFIFLTDYKYILHPFHKINIHEMETVCLCFFYIGLVLNKMSYGRYRKGTEVNKPSSNIQKVLVKFHRFDPSILRHRVESERRQIKQC